MTERPHDGPALLHVGYIKTATTSLQRHVFGAAAMGFGLAGGAAHRAYLVERFRAGDPYAFDPAAVAAEMTEMEQPLRAAGLTPVWSDETLLGNPLTRDYCGAAVADRFARLPRRFRVLITIREQRAFCLSAYAEFLNLGRNPLDDFIGRGDEPMSFSPILEEHFLNYAAAVARWREIAGPENVLVLPMELLSADPAAYLGRLAAFLGRPAPSPPPASRANASRGATALAAARRLNSLFVRSPLGGPPSAAQRWVGRALRGIDRLSPPALDRAIRRRWRARIEARYAGAFTADNRRLEEMTGLDLSAWGYQLPD